LDLKGVRNVIILEKGWNQASDEQVIGRAIRYRSHAALPPEQRVVDVYHLVLIKKDDQLLANTIKSGGGIDEKKIIGQQRNFPSAKRMSADLYLLLLGMQKQKEIDKTRKWLEDASIFKNPKCTS
jgi:hypothetical protein